MKRKNRDPLLRLARRVCRHLEPSTPTIPFESLAGWDRLSQSYYDLCRARGLAAVARRRGWGVAADRRGSELPEHLRQLQDAAQHLLKQPTRLERRPDLAFVFAELRQLETEFEHARLDREDREERLVVNTDPIVLEGVSLGRFAIELRLEYLASRPDSSCFQCVALEPNAASANEFVTHPHVNDQGLCAGDATVPIALALCEGRLCDAFILVRSVLGTYNPASAYVRIEDWDGASCPDCECTVAPHELYPCEHCGSQVCDDCMGMCDVCEQSCCRNCLAYDSVGRRDCCPDCRGQCAACGRTVATDDLHPPSALCPDCLQESQEHTTTPTPTENPDHEPQFTPLPASSPVPAPAA